MQDKIQKKASKSHETQKEVSKANISLENANIWIIWLAVVLAYN